MKRPLGAAERQQGETDLNQTVASGVRTRHLTVEASEDQAHRVHLNIVKLSPRVSPADQPPFAAAVISSIRSIGRRARRRSSSGTSTSGARSRRQR